MIPVYRTLLFAFFVFLSTTSVAQISRLDFGTSVTVVNMIPYELSGEHHQDSEPNIAVNPENPLQIAGSAFTPNPMEDQQSTLLTHIKKSHFNRNVMISNLAVMADDDGGGELPPSEGFLAPIYVSTDGGMSWSLNPIISNANDLTGTRDITLRFSSWGGMLYAALLEGTSGFTLDRECPVLDPSAGPEDEVFVKDNECVPIYGPRMIIKRTSDFTSSEEMIGFRSGKEFQDQPYIQVSSVQGSNGREDRVVVANNDLNRSTNLFPGSTIADSRTASVDRSLKGNNQPGGIYNSLVIEPNSPLGQNGSGVRVAIHRSGTIYGVFYRLTNKSIAEDQSIKYSTDVVVVRDDNWANDTDAFADLVNPTSGTIGSVVAPFRVLPIRATSRDENNICVGPGPNMGQERLVASDISIAVHPQNKDIVYVAWADSERGNHDSYNLHVRKSEDGGSSWSEDLIMVTRAKNPALAVNRRGTLGFLYQAYQPDEENPRWITHFQKSDDDDNWTDYVLANVPANDPPCQFQPYIGDYVHLMTVDVNFYGIFSASNQPDPENFPYGVTYQRYVHPDGTLRSSPIGEVVPPSIDPFFFKVTQPWIPEVTLDR